MFKKIYLSVLIILYSSIAFAKDDITISIGEWEPFISKEFEGYGPLTTIAKKSLELQNISVTYKFFPWKRALYNLSNKKVEASLAWSKTPKREKKFLYSKKPLMINKNVFFHLKDLNFDWNRDIKSLKKYNLGITRGYAYQYALQKAIANKKITPDIGISDLKNLQKLLLGRINLFLCNETVGKTLIKKHFSKEDQDKFTFSQKAFTYKKLYFITNKTNEELMENFDLGFLKFKQSVEYNTLLSK